MSSLIFELISFLFIAGEASMAKANEAVEKPQNHSRYPGSQHFFREAERVSGEGCFGLICEWLAIHGR
jgi:hypothetical protein